MPQRLALRVVKRDTQHGTAPSQKNSQTEKSHLKKSRGHRSLDFATGSFLLAKALIHLNHTFTLYANYDVDAVLHDTVSPTAKNPKILQTHFPLLPALSVAERATLPVRARKIKARVSTPMEVAVSCAERPPTSLRIVVCESKVRFALTYPPTIYSQPNPFSHARTHIGATDSHETVFGTGAGAGADEDDFHIVKRRTHEVEADERRQEKLKRKLDIGVGVHSGTIVMPEVRAVGLPQKKVVYF